MSRFQLCIVVVYKDQMYQIITLIRQRSTTSYGVLF